MRREEERATRRGKGEEAREDPKAQRPRLSPFSTYCSRAWCPLLLSLMPCPLSSHGLLRDLLLVFHDRVNGAYFRFLIL